MRRKRLLVFVSLFLVTGVSAVLTVVSVAAAQAQATRDRSAALAVAGVPPEAGQWYKARGPVADALSIPADSTATVRITGKAGIPASGVASVALNIAVSGADRSGQLIVYPTGVTKPDTTTIRYRKDFFTQNLVFMKVGSDGTIKISNEEPTTVTIYADVHGYTLHAAGSWAGQTMVPIVPARLGQVSVPANSTVQVAPLGKAGIPSTGVSDVMFTMSAKSATAGKLVVYPSDGTKPGDTNLDYGLDLTFQNQVIARLGADGKVNINNAGTKAVTVTVDMTGYWATPTAAVRGSTTHALTPARIATDVTIAANGTYTLAPLGQGGVPAAGVSGVYLNATTYGASSGGIRIYPTGVAAPTVHTVSNMPGLAYSGALPAKLGSDGKVTIQNAGTSPVRVWVDVFAYFRAPVSGCATAAPAKATAAESVPIESFSRTTVVQASPVGGGSVGTLELAYTDNIGRLLHGRADPSVLSAVQWTAVHGNEAYTGSPALAEQADGRLQMLAHNVDGPVWTMTQATKSPPVWGSWGNTGQPMGSHVSVARYGDTLVGFAVDAAGVLWALPQYEPNGAYQGWMNLGATGLATGAAPVVVPVADGVRIFALDSAGTWRTAVYSQGTVSGCAAISGSGLSGTASVVVYPGSRLRIFVRGADGRILTKLQDDAGGFPQEWTPVGDFVAAGSPSAVISPGSGKTEVVARGSDGKIYSTGETIQGSGEWRSWVNAHADDSYVAATDPTAFEYFGTNGATWAFTFRTSGQTSLFYTPSSEMAQMTRTAPTFKGRALPKPPAR